MSVDPRVLAFLADALRFVWLVPALPLLAAAVIAVRLLGRKGGGDDKERPTAAIASGAALAALCLLLLVDLASVLGVEPAPVETSDWLRIGRVAVTFSLVADAWSLSAATLIALIGWLALRFSVTYLHRERGFERFFFGMSLFLAGMLLIVLAGNAVLCFVGWELAGFSSWLLVAYAWERPTATGNALFVFVTNRIGDAGFLLAIALAVWSVGSLDWEDLTAGGKLDIVTVRLLSLGLLLAALVKSAQLPFTPWIARALEGPTPSSAVFYGSLMVHAGVYLLCRAQGLLVQVPDLMVLLTVGGVLTALYAGLCGLVQSDVKSALIYSTVTQVGLMFACCGLGLFSLAAVHAALHATWRAYQFLCAPSYMHLVRWPAPAVARWLGRRRWLYTAVLRRFWLEALAGSLLVRPTLALGRDVRAFDERFVDPLIGVPRDDRPGVPGGGAGEALIRGHGVAGSALVYFADRLQRIEEHLLFRGGGGATGRLLQRAGHCADVVEALIEQPRYLMLMVMATLAVIL